jgi:hypothetical protein
MYNQESRKKWLESMKEKLGVSTEEEVKAWFKLHALESKGNPTGKGGFGDKDAATRKEISKKGAAARWGTKY